MSSIIAQVYFLTGLAIVLSAPTAAIRGRFMGFCIAERFSLLPGVLYWRFWPGLLIGAGLPAGVLAAGIFIALYRDIGREALVL